MMPTRDTGFQRAMESIGYLVESTDHAAVFALGVVVLVILMAVAIFGPRGGYARLKLSLLELSVAAPLGLGSYVSQDGSPGGVPLGLLISVLTSGIVVAACCREWLAAWQVAAGALIGGFFGLVLLSDIILHSAYLYDHGNGETVKCNLEGAIIGAALGAFLVAVRNTRYRL